MPRALYRLAARFRGEDGPHIPGISLGQIRAKLPRLITVPGNDLNPSPDARDALERLDNIIPDKGSPADLNQTFDKTAPELTPALEPEVEEHVLAPVIDFML